MHYLLSLAFVAALRQAAPMNTASQNLPHHLGILRERMLHPTDYDLALNYFLEEFAGDVKFLEASEPDGAPHLFAVLAHVASKALGKKSAFDEVKLFLLREHGFYHGNAAVAGRVLLFFYFQDADTGLAALIPGTQGAMDVARFRLTTGLPDPRKN
jgi:hypothetical protein